MDMLKIEQVIVGSELRSTSAEIKSEPVIPLQSYQHANLQCFQCFITFCDSKAKERHMKNNHRDQYKQQLQQTNTVFTCYKCNKCFSSSNELSQHQASHSIEEKPFGCTYCHKSYFTFSELNKHRRYECIQRRCPCYDCGALFPSRARLRNHRVSVHPDRPPVVDGIDIYQCCKCGCGFQTEEDLLKHQENCTSKLICDVRPRGKKRGRKPKCAEQSGFDIKKVKLEEDATGGEGYGDSPKNGCQPQLKIPCPEAHCDLIFPSVEALRAHKKGKHGPHPRKANVCTECDESYSQPEQLKAHIIRAHCSVYTCPTCGKSFAQENVLKVHQNTHIEEKDFAEKR